jgi:hypothetical protein
VSTRLRLLLHKSAAFVSGNQSFLKAPDYLPPAIKAVFEGGIAALDHYRPRYYPGKANFLVCGYHEYPAEGARAIWDGLFEQFELQSVPPDHAEVASAHAEYVARWLFGRIQDATALDVTCLAAPATNGLASMPEPSLTLSVRLTDEVAERISGSGAGVFTESRDHA